MLSRLGNSLSTDFFTDLFGHAFTAKRRFLCQIVEIGECFLIS